jgi:hypothetical protein
VSIYGKGTKGRATRLHSLVVRARGACECCGESRYELLQCAHIVTRERNATRTDEHAAFCLCKGCHWRFTHDPLEWVDFVVSKIGRGAYDDIQRRSKAGVKANEAFWRAEEARLLEWCRELEIETRRSA